MRSARSLLPFGMACFVAALGAIGACSSKQGTIPGGGLTGPPQNAADGGAAYPTSHLGTAQRGLSNGTPNTTPGSVIQNMKFLGYPTGAASGSLQTVQLSDYYDPSPDNASKHKILHIMAVAEWCNPCNIETSELITDLGTPSTDYEAQGVVFLQALMEGEQHNVGATQQDLDTWIGTVKPPFAEVLDPEAANLGVFFAAADVPFNMDIDTRSMEVLQAGTGQEDPSAVSVWITWVNNNPPSYSQ